VPSFELLQSSLAAAAHGGPFENRGGRTCPAKEISIVTGLGVRKEVGFK
jgi:hypothetical protein